MGSYRPIASNRNPSRILPPHKLSVSYEGLWECHIKGDWLLIWQQNDTELILIMTDTGTHADLF